MNGDERWAARRPRVRHDASGSEVGEMTHMSDQDTLADVAELPSLTGMTGAARQRQGSSEQTPQVSRTAQTSSGALARLRALGAAANAVGAALGLSTDDLAAREAFDRLERAVTLRVEQVAALSEANARDWFDTLGDDLTLDLTLEGLDSALEPVTAALRAEDEPVVALAAFQEQALAVAATQGDSVSVSVRLSVGKRQALRLAEQALRERREMQGLAGAVTAPEAAVVFYHAAACERLLTLRAAPEWGRRGLGGGETRLCVVVCERAGYLAGPALEVVGAASETGHETERETAAEWLPISRAAWRRFVERATAARRLRDAESAWSGLTLALLPDHLRVVARAPGLEGIAARLQALRAQVAACALASHVERVETGSIGGAGAGSETPETADAPGDLILRFAGARPAVARLTSGAQPRDLRGLEAQPRDALIELADWAYRDASPDKLAIARQALADTLMAGATLTLAQLCVAASPALDTARANLAIYLRGATERYFQVRAAAQQTVSGFAEATRAAVASLTSDVTDNLFRTVGLIVGVVIAWLIQPSASLTLAKIAAALYTAYVVFIIRYLLRARQARYHLERKGLDDTLAAMSELAPAERVRLRRPAVDAEAHFEAYYRLTRAIYSALAVLGVVVFLLMFTPLASLVLPYAAR